MAFTIPSIDEIFELLFPEESPTVTTQKRTITPERDKPFTLTMVVEDSGDLPDRGLFKYRILDESRPETDEFAAVATAEEFDEFSTKRSRELLKDNQFYRAPSIELFFEDVTDAQQRVENINDAVNSTAKDYNILVHQFLTDGDGETITFPKGTTGSLDVKKARYRELGTDIESLETQIDTLETQRDDIEAFREDIVDIGDATATVQSAITDAIPTGSQIEAELGIIRNRLSLITGDFAGVETLYRENIVGTLITTKSGTEINNQFGLSYTEGDGKIDIDGIHDSFISVISWDDAIGDKMEEVAGNGSGVDGIPDHVRKIRTSLTPISRAFSDIGEIRSSFESNVLSELQSTLQDLSDKLLQLNQQIETLNKELDRKESQRETLLAEIQRVDPSFDPDDS